VDTEGGAMTVYLVTLKVYPDMGEGGASFKVDSVHATPEGAEVARAAASDRLKSWAKVDVVSMEVQP